MTVKIQNSLKRYRQFAGYTQKEFSRMLKMPFSTYQQKEQGRIGFSNYEMLNIRNVLSKKIGSITVDDIFLTNCTFLYFLKFGRK